MDEAIAPGPSYQTNTGVDGIRFPDAFGPILVALIVAGAVTLAILRSRRGPGRWRRSRDSSMRYGADTGPRDWIRHQTRARRSFSCPSVAVATVVPDIVADLGAACHRGRAIVCSPKGTLRWPMSLRSRTSRSP